MYGIGKHNFRQNGLTCWRKNTNQVENRKETNKCVAPKQVWSKMSYFSNNL